MDNIGRINIRRQLLSHFCVWLEKSRTWSIELFISSVQEQMSHQLCHTSDENQGINVLSVQKSRADPLPTPSLSEQWLRGVTEGQLHHCCRSTQPRDQCHATNKERKETQDLRQSSGTSVGQKYLRSTSVSLWNDGRQPKHTLCGDVSQPLPAINLKLRDNYRTFHA
ncbi:hypothetical protein BC938DRAFT_478662 [Jimgerdemannia flammicorona]|uniref:Uncharacterized protein n=1 Tax=Jimgerdemannia flammicorona TaxID=994334 RepID=A0A433QYG1_9FUNG|nr:hypothetical protein BC938DRAFT_478662 [Jimgerdemannia flammicorona]